MNDAAPQMRVRFDVDFSNGRTGHKRLRERRPKTKKEAPPPPSRLARLLALAHHFDDMTREGVVHDQAEIARLMKVTRAWVTRIMNLLFLAPDVQEDVLLTAQSEKKRPISMKRIHRIVAGNPDPALNPIDLDLLCSQGLPKLIRHQG